MKTKTVKRGLYNRTTTTPETWDEARTHWKQMASALDTYIENTERYASEIIREAGIDPETLFDRVETENGSRYVRHVKIDRDTLAPEVEGALKVLITIHDDIRPRLDDERGGMLAGIRLAQEIERLKSNLTWGRTVEGRRKSNRNLPHGSPLSDDDIREALKKYPTRAEQAKRLGITERQLQNRIKSI